MRSALTEKELHANKLRAKFIPLSDPFSTDSYVSIFTYYPVILVPEANNADVEWRPLGNLSAYVVAIIESNQRSLVADWITMILWSGDQMLNLPVCQQFCSLCKRLHSPFLYWECVNVVAVGLNRPGIAGGSNS
jgi:hypothetical protein